MNLQQFRVLYRQFLFRVVDLELLSPQGDMSRLLGQFAALLVFFSAVSSLGVLMSGDGRTPRAELLVNAWGMQHSLIATTMLVVGLFAVLSWESIFPDRRDVLVLGALPVSARTLFLAKVAASASALGLTIVSFNALPSLAWPLTLAPPTSTIVDLILTPELYRAFAAYWATMAAGGAFLFGCVLTVQGLASQVLRRNHFLRVSAFLQLGAFCLLVSVYCLQPRLATPQGLAAAENAGVLAWLPSYWFLGMFQELNGSMHPVMAPLARRAWVSLGLALAGGFTAYAASYFRTLRKVMEEPDITPAPAGVMWPPRFGGPLATAVCQFTIRTLLRSRQHRVILAFYLGIGFAVTIFFLRLPAAPQSVDTRLMAASFVMLLVWVVGMRVVFSMPLDLRANWVFRVAPLRSGRTPLQAGRRALFSLAVIPAWSGAAAVFLWMWPWNLATAHLVILGLTGAVLAEVCLQGTQKIPFTCSYLPGKTNMHIALLFCVSLLMTMIHNGAEWERRALENPLRYGVTVGCLATAAVLLRWRADARAMRDNRTVSFEQVEAPLLTGLGLWRDGAPLQPE